MRAWPGVLLLLWPDAAAGQVRLDLEWDAPQSCPQAEAVRDRVRSLAGAAWSTAERLHAAGRIVRSGDRYRLTLTVQEGGAARERNMESDSCTDLAGAAAVALGLLLRHAPEAADSGDTTATAGSGGTASATDSSEHKASDGSTAGSSAATRSEKASPAVKTPAKERPAASEQAPSPDSPEGAHHLHFLLRAPVVTGALLTLPAASVGLGGGLGLRYDGWRLMAQGRVFAAQTLRDAYDPETGVRVSRATAELSVCHGWRSLEWELAPCLGVTLNRFTPTGRGADVLARSHGATVPAVEAGGTAHVYLAEWAALVASVNIGISSSRPRFVVEGFGRVGRVGAAELSMEVGPEWIF